MRTYEPLLDLQDELAGQLQHSIQLGIVSAISQMCDAGASDLLAKTQHIAEGTKVTKHIFGDFYKLCQKVKKTLDFEEDVDFYITQNPEINAYALRSDTEGMPHIINIHSALFEMMNEKELMFILGHELGHLINMDGVIGEGIRFVYPQKEDIPLFLKKRIELYNLLAELSADRSGYLACNDLEAAIRTMYKLSCGVDVEKFNITLKDMLEESEEQLNFLKTDGLSTHSSHPFNQIRVKALELFANAKTDSELEKGMDELIFLLQEFGGSDEDRFMMDFMVSAGIMMIHADNQESREEYDTMIEKLGELTWAPEAYIEKMSKKDLSKVFNASAKKLVELGKEEEMIHYLVDIALADGRIEESEVKTIFDLGKKFGCPLQMIAMAIGRKIREDYRPLAINLNNREPEATAADSEEDSNYEVLGKEEIESEDSELFMMHVSYKVTVQEHKVVVFGEVECGHIKTGDRILLSNSKKAIEDIVLGVISGNYIVDSSYEADSNEPFGIMLANTGSRAINGNIEEWMIQAIQ